MNFLDNNRVLVEALKGGRYHAVERWTDSGEKIVCQPVWQYAMELTTLLSHEPSFESYSIRNSAN
jgi:predicted restriction endonuclease